MSDCCNPLLNPFLPLIVGALVGLIVYGFLETRRKK